MKFFDKLSADVRTGITEEVTTEVKSAMLTLMIEAYENDDDSKFNDPDHLREIARRFAVNAVPIATRDSRDKKGKAKGSKGKPDGFGWSYVGKSGATGSAKGHGKDPLPAGVALPPFPLVGRSMAEGKGSTGSKGFKGGTSSKGFTGYKGKSVMGKRDRDEESYKTAICKNWFRGICWYEVDPVQCTFAHGWDDPSAPDVYRTNLKYDYFMRCKDENVKPDDSVTWTAEDEQRHQDEQSAKARGEDVRAIKRARIAKGKEKGKNK